MIVNQKMQKKIKLQNQKAKDLTYKKILKLLNNTCKNKIVLTV